MNIPIFAFSAELPWTAFMNRVFGSVGNAVLEMFGVHAHDPAHPFTNWMAMQILVALILVGVFALLRMRLSADNPNGLQHTFEVLQEFVEKQSKEIIGPHSERFTPFLMALGLFILFANMLGMIPGFESPTANPAVPFGCAIATFVYYNVHGVMHAGPIGYLKHFMGPMPAIAPLLFVIEIISHLARLMSLTIRLFANIFAGDMVTLAFFSLIPLAVPVVFLGLHIGVSLVQAYIFVLLTTVYLEGAVAEAH